MPIKSYISEDRHVSVIESYSGHIKFLPLNLEWLTHPSTRCCRFKVAISRWPGKALKPAILI